MDHQKFAEHVVEFDCLPEGWSIIGSRYGSKSGSGTYLIPAVWENQTWLKLKQGTFKKWPVMGDRKVVFEFFRLDSGKIKLSARCYYQFNSKVLPSFEKLEKWSRECKAGEPGHSANARATKSVLVERDSAPYGVQDFAGMAQWLSGVLRSSSSPLKKFVEGVPGILSK